MICDLCDDSGQVYEACDCYQCEYTAQHARYLPCPQCAAGLIRWVQHDRDCPAAEKQAVPRVRELKDGPFFWTEWKFGHCYCGLDDVLEALDLKLPMR